MTRRSFSARVGLAVLMCSALLVTASATGAGATGTTTGHATPFTASHTGELLGHCPPNLDYPTSDTGQYHRIKGITRTRLGPATLRLDLCWVFVGAIGGEGLTGFFEINTRFGSLKGTAQGTNGHGASEHYGLVLTVSRGTGFLRNVAGTIALDGSQPRTEGAPIAGTLISDLRRDIGWWHHRSVPFPFT